VFVVYQMLELCNWRCRRVKDLTWKQSLAIRLQACGPWDSIERLGGKPQWCGGYPDPSFIRRGRTTLLPHLPFQSNPSGSCGRPATGGGGGMGAARGGRMWDVWKRVPVNRAVRRHGSVLSGSSMSFRSPLPPGGGIGWKDERVGGEAACPYLMLGSQGEAGRQAGEGEANSPMLFGAQNSEKIRARSKIGSSFPPYLSISMRSTN